MSSNAQHAIVAVQLHVLTTNDEQWVLLRTLAMGQSALDWQECSGFATPRIASTAWPKQGNAMHACHAAMNRTCGGMQACPHACMPACL